MPVVELRTQIADPPMRVFDLARSVDLHTRSMDERRERAVGGTVTGLLELGERVTWRARHFGVWFELTSEIVAFDPPRHFRDRMAAGPFARFDHDHEFRPVDGGTEMTDRFDFASPFGVVGRLVDRWILARYLDRLLRIRNDVIRAVAEGVEWRTFVLPESSPRDRKIADSGEDA